MLIFAAVNAFKYILLVLLAAAALGSCRSSRAAAVRGSSATPLQPQAAAVVAAGEDCPVVKAALEWLGTPYRYGGNDRDGVDCSGLVCAAFLSAENIRLPRTSREQSAYCLPLDRSDLRPGDLVFFTSAPGGDRINHVAIYAGDSCIVHATTSRGVIISNLAEGYWKRHYSHSGRVP